MEAECPLECHCNLFQIMTERRLTIEGLARLARIGPDPITALRRNDWHAVSRRTIERLCAALGIGMGELFTLVRRDLWYPVHASHEVTIHLGSTRLPDSSAVSAPLSAGQAEQHTREYISAHDHRAFRQIIHHLTSFPAGLELRIKEHGADRDVYAANSPRSLDELFPTGNHVVIGSPLSNSFAEAVVAATYAARPYLADDRSHFPYGFVWSPHRTVASAFGWAGTARDVGIASTSSGELVAQRTSPAADGVGHDCAMIVVTTLFKPVSRRRFANDDTRTIIFVGGHGALGTEAGARIATDREFAARLSPPKNAAPRMGVVSTTYLHRADRRNITDTSLVALA